MMTIDRKAGAGQRRRAERALVHALDGVAHTRQIAREHLDIGHAMMAERHRLRACRWVKPGITVAACSSARSRKTAISPFSAGGDRCSSRFTHSRKSTATWSLRERAVCRRPAAGADQLGEPRLDVHVDVFERARELELAGLDL